MMKVKGATRGQMRIIETILASFVVVAAIAFMNTMAINPPSPRYEASELEKIGYNALNALNEQGLLSRYVYDREWNTLQAALRVSLPADVYFNLTIESFVDPQSYQRYPEASISYGADNIAASNSAALVIYVLSGTDYYDLTRILSLQLVRR
jgi:hypothetical protein